MLEFSKITIYFIPRSPRICAWSAYCPVVRFSIKLDNGAGNGDIAEDSPLKTFT